MELTSNCKICGLYQYSSCPRIIGRGNSINPRVILIGEAPGPDEAKQGKPFIGKAGKKLDKMISEYGNIFYITNMVKCFPPLSTTNPDKGFRVPKDIEIELCKSFLENELETISNNGTILNPILMPLGNVALKGLIGTNKGITKELGVWKDVVINGRQYCLVPNYHPSYILRNPSMESEFKRVLKDVLKD